MTSTRPGRATIDRAKRVCLFGVGVLLQECYGQIVLALGREPDLLCDNDPKKWNQQFFGRPCVSPEELAAQAESTLVIITTRRWEAISAQLRATGISEMLVASFDRAEYALAGWAEAAFSAPIPEPLIADLHGKWTLVTGASRGIGRQIALAMAEQGSNLILHARTADHLQAVGAACRAQGVEVVEVPAELSDLEELKGLLAYLQKDAPAVDVLFNNAAVSTPAPENLWEIPAEVFQTCLSVNVTAPSMLCQTLIPPMLARGFGRIVNLHTHLYREPLELPYVCSKAALAKLVREYTPRLEGTGVSITLADPGWVRTDAGTYKAPNEVESVIPGVLLGALLDERFNGHCFNAQEYAGLPLGSALRRAHSLLAQHPSTWN